MEIIRILTLLSVVVLLHACSEDDPIPLQANAGASQSVAPLKDVTLDGTASSGPEGFTYSWSYVGDVPESEIDFLGKTTTNPTFTPPRDGSYFFTLTISDGASSNSDDVTVVASGAAEIGGTLTEDMYLYNIQPIETLPDYIVSTDLTVENGIKLVIAEDGVRIEFRSDRGIHIKTDGALTNADTTEDKGFDTEFFGDEGWKGILVEDGKVNLRNSIITNAGKTAFAGYDEPAAVTFGDRNSTIVNFKDNEFIASHSYDLYAPVSVHEPGFIKSNQFSYDNPFKAPLTFMEAFSHYESNMYPDEFDYVWLLPRTDGEKDDMDTPYIFDAAGKYLIDGNFYTGTRIELSPGTTIYMKEDASIVTEAKLLSFGTSQKKITIAGLNGAEWRGIANISSSTLSNPSEFNYTTISDAGYGIITAGSFTAEASAAVYATNDGFMDDSKILNCGGYGYYNEADKRTFFKIRRTHFETQLAAVRTFMTSVEQTLTLVHSSTFDLPDGVPACLVHGDGSVGIWPGLGDGNFYLVDGNIIAKDGKEFTLDEGAHVKFKAGRALIRDIEGSSVFFRGRIGNPVIIEGEEDAPGSWGGIYMAGKFRIEGTIIRNGGEFVLPGATEKANFVSDLTVVNQYHIMVESQFNDSAGWGIVVESGSVDFGYDDAANNNSFNDNADGNILRK